MSRRIAREVAMKQLYTILVKGEGEYDELIELSGMQSEPEGEDKKYATAVSQGVQAHLEEIDELITKHLKNWNIERLGLVDKCIMRVAVYEMLYMDDVPQSVSINEAIELARQFCDVKSPSFINGVLGGISRAEEQINL